MLQQLPVTKQSCRRHGRNQTGRVVPGWTTFTMSILWTVVSLTMCGSYCSAFKTTNSVTTVSNQHFHPYPPNGKLEMATMMQPLLRQQQQQLLLVQQQQQQHRLTGTTIAAKSTAATILKVATGGSDATGMVSSPSKLAFVEWNRDRIQRSMMASIGCMVTWMMANALPFPFTIVQASCTTGLLACLLFTTPIPFLLQRPSYSVATFCGALAGMSGNLWQYTSTATVTSTTTASFLPLALFSGCVGYAFGLWDDRKWGVGKGGRLGTIAFGGNLLYTMTTFLYQTIVLKNNLPLFTLIPSTTKQLFASMPLLTSLALSTWLLRSSRTTNSDTSKSLSTTTDTQQQQYISKILLYSTIAIPMFMSGSKGIVGTITEYMGTVLSIFIGSQLVHKNIGKYGPILPTSVVGMIGSILFANRGYFGITSPKLFLGALMGLTTIPTFGAFNFIQSSFLSAVLFHLGLLDGFGGKLGCLAYVGVLFGM